MTEAKQTVGLEERKAALDKEIRWYVERGSRVESRTDTTASLRRPKKFSLFWSLVWFLGFGVGIIVYLLYYAGKRDDTRYLEVLEDGTMLKDGEPLPPPREDTWWRRLLLGSEV